MLSQADPLRARARVATPQERVLGGGSASAPSHVPQRKYRRTTKSDAIMNPGTIKTLLSLPIETFILVTQHLLPVDVLYLARTNKPLRNLLMKQSSVRIWTNAIENFPGLPACPSHLSEPKYISLLFTDTCMECGDWLTRQMDPWLYVLLCVRCRPKLLVRDTDVFEPFHPLLSWSADIVPSNDKKMTLGNYTLAADVQRLQEDYQARVKEGSFIGALQGDPWYHAKFLAQTEREEHQMAAILFLEARRAQKRGNDRSKKRAFRQSVENRLVEMGWERCVINFPSDKPKEYKALLEQSKVLNDRVWEKLYSKLLPFLQGNHKSLRERQALEPEN